MNKLPIDETYLRQTLLELLAIPSPVGLTDEVVHYSCRQLEQMGVPYALTRTGAIRATIAGRVERPARAVVAHLDTLGAVVRALKDNGRLRLMPLGTWSSRFAEGARATVFTDRGRVRGTILPLMASGHAFNDAVDTQPVSWDHVELRIDLPSESAAELAAHGIQVGDHVAIDPQPEITDSGFVCSRHLDDKAGVAALLAAIRAIREAGITPPITLHPMFTITEEIGFGASAILDEHISEMVGVDIAIPASGQNSRERGVTIAMADSSGPFDYHLTRRLIALCTEHDIEHRRDVFPYYFSDSAAALRAGFDIRHALVGFGADASHGWERTHLHALTSLAELLTLYAQQEPVVARDDRPLGPRKGFPHQIPVDEMPAPQPELPDPRELFGDD